MKDSNLNNEQRPFPSLEEVCVSNPPPIPVTTHPSVPAVHLAATYACQDPGQADRILGRSEFGFAYQRESHPNALRLAEKFRLMHHADEAAVAGSGMAALAAIVLNVLSAGQHVLLSRYLYGKSAVLIQQELSRWGVDSTEFDPLNLESVERAVEPGRTRLLLVETIANPLLQVPDLPALIGLGRRYDFQVAVDNTFATPYACRPLSLGADWVWESVSKMLNGHSDLMMGVVCGRADRWGLLHQRVATWGLGAAPWDCYLAERGLSTFALRIEAAVSNAARVAGYLQNHAAVSAVWYPGLTDSSARERWLKNASRPPRDVDGVWTAGNIVTLNLNLQRGSVEAFLERSGLKYFPSLGECGTTVSHPASSSHRHLSPEQRAALGLSEGTLRLSIGIEPIEWLIERLNIGLRSV
jgi:cystathionine beta-lyase/cystathionine gamma-synthase